MSGGLAGLCAISGLGALVGGESAAPSFSPSDLANLQIWLEADSLAASLNNGDPVATWDNQGALADFAQGTGSRRPSWVTNVINGHPVVRFDGTDDRLQIPSSDYQPTSFTLYVVEKSTGDACFTGGAHSATNYQVRVGISGANKISMYMSDPAVEGGDSLTLSVARGTARLVVYRWVNPGIVFYENGVTQGIASINRANYYIGGVGALISQNALHLNGDVAAFLLYSGAHSDADRGQVEEYLRAKYGLY